VLQSQGGWFLTGSPASQRANLDAAAIDHLSTSWQSQQRCWVL